jgi:hypothetical protein
MGDPLELGRFLLYHLVGFGLQAFDRRKHGFDGFVQVKIFFNNPGTLNR